MREKLPRHAIRRLAGNKLGHVLERRVNQGDAGGDEGALFFKAISFELQGCDSKAALASDVSRDDEDYVSETIADLPLWYGPGWRLPSSRWSRAWDCLTGGCVSKQCIFNSLTLIGGRLQSYFAAPPVSAEPAMLISRVLPTDASISDLVGERASTVPTGAAMCTHG